MPFSRLEGTSSADPIFIFPGIFLYGLDISGFVKELNKTHPGRTLCIYHHPLYDNNKAPAFADLKAMLADMKKEIFSIQPKKARSTKYNLVGVSWGGALTELLAHSLKEEDVTVNAHIIDTPTLTTLQKHFVTGNIMATRDLIDIINSIAKMYGLPERTFSEEEIQEISKLPLSSTASKPEEERKDQISKISHRFLRFDLPNLAEFTVMVKVVSEQIRMMPTFVFNPQTKLNCLQVMTTRETREKFRTPLHTDRTETADKIVLVNLTSENPEMTHKNCVNEKNAPILVSHILEQLPILTASHKLAIDTSKQRQHEKSVSAEYTSSDDDEDDMSVFSIPSGLIKASSSPDSSPMSSPSPSSSSSDDEEPVKQRRKTSLRAPLASAIHASRNGSSSPVFFKPAGKTTAILQHSHRASSFGKRA